MTFTRALVLSMLAASGWFAGCASKPPAPAPGGLMDVAERPGEKALLAGIRAHEAAQVEALLGALRWLDVTVNPLRVAPGDYAESVGWTGPDVWCAHCVKLDVPGIGLFARTGTGVAHCPEPVYLVGAEVTDIPAMRASFAVSVRRWAIETSA